jgi:hypothetical protein
MAVGELVPAVRVHLERQDQVAVQILRQWGHMEDRILSNASLVVLSVILGGYGIRTVIAVYRTGTEKAVVGSLAVIASALLCHVLAGLFT